MPEKFEGLSREEIIEQFNRTLRADSAAKEELARENRRLNLALEAAHTALSQDEAAILSLEAWVAELLCLTEVQEQLIGIDHLTKAPTRARIMAHLETDIAFCRRNENVPLSLIFADLDHFREINRLYGHQGGDAVLAQFAERCQKTLRRYDFFGRYAGDEFVIILLGISSENALVVAERIRRLTADTPFAYNDPEKGELLIRATVSLGVATLQRDDKTATLVKLADMAAFRAKEIGGGNQIATAARA